MLRIKGRIGDWPVDLTVELDGAEWAQLRGLLPAAAVEAPPAAAPAAAPASASDRLWALAQELLRRAGALDGPQLFAELSALAGGEEAGKRLLVRLRHSGQVKVSSGGDTPLYTWIDPL